MLYNASDRELDNSNVTKDEASVGIVGLAREVARNVHFLHVANGTNAAWSVSSVALLGEAADVQDALVLLGGHGCLDDAAASHVRCSGVVWPVARVIDAKKAWAPCPLCCGVRGRRFVVASAWKVEPLASVCALYAQFFHRARVMMGKSWLQPALWRCGVSERRART